MADDVVEWILQTIKTEWPAGEANFPAEIQRINRDDARNLDTGERSRTIDLENGIPIGASLASHDREPIGLSYNYRIETVVSVRVEGLHEDEFGHVASSTEFSNLVDDVKEAIDRERKDPPIDAKRGYYDTIIPENETSQSSDNRDYFREDFDLRLTGFEFRND